MNKCRRERGPKVLNKILHAPKQFKKYMNQIQVDVRKNTTKRKGR